MKQYALVLALSLATPLALAQPPSGSFEPHEPPTVERRVAFIANTLSLSDDQIVQLTESLSRLESERKVLMTQMEALRQQEKAALETVLTEEQLDTLTSKRQKWAGLR